VPISPSRARRALVLTARWATVLLFPIASWLAVSAAVAITLPEQAGLTLRPQLFWWLGLAITVLAIAVVGLFAQADAAHPHVANLLTIAFVSNHLSMNEQASFAIGLFEYLFALVLGFSIAVIVWLWRRKQMPSPEPEIE
jgi:hypothetical protein